MVTKEMLKPFYDDDVGFFMRLRQGDESINEEEKRDILLIADKVKHAIETNQPCPVGFTAIVDFLDATTYVKNESIQEVRDLVVEKISNTNIISDFLENS